MARCRTRCRRMQTADAAFARHSSAHRDHGGASRSRIAAARGTSSRPSRSIAPYTIEEAYEVADAIERGDLEDLREELGDLLLQVVFHARMAEEAGLFDFGGVVEAITAKLIRRHPHVFGDARELDADAVKALWGRIKAEEKRERAEARDPRRACPQAPQGALAGVPAVPARADARAQASGEGRQGRLRLERRPAR